MTRKVLPVQLAVRGVPGPSRAARRSPPPAEGWRIQFSGRAHEDVEFFLYRVEQHRDMYRISEASLLAALPFLLQGPALAWYTEWCSDSHSWSQVRDSFSLAFGIPGANQFTVAEGLQPQGPCESVRSLFESLRGYFRRCLPVMSEANQVSLAHGALLPHLRSLITIRPSTTLEELETAARRHEMIKALADWYEFPPEGDIDANPSPESS